MFNRTLKFEVVKVPKDDAPKIPLTDEEKVERLIYWHQFGRSVAKDVAKIAVGYLVLDTWRKATIAKAAAKVCCDCVVK